MMIDYIMNVDVPYKFCRKCKMIEPTKEPYITRFYCEHEGICRNLVELVTSKNGKKNDE